MSKRLNLIKTLLVEEIQEKMTELPFGYGEQEGNEGFPRWSIYIDKNNKIHSENDNDFDQNKSIVENLLSLPLEQLAHLAQYAICGDDLFKQINNNRAFEFKMCRQSLEDAESWKINHSLKIKP